MQIPKKFLFNKKAFAVLLMLFGLFGLIVMFMQYKNQIADNKEAILQNVHTHILGLVNLKTWNDFYGGVYVIKRSDVKASLVDDMALRCDYNQTLIRINHAWMLRQLSERNRCTNYRFRISSLHPKNPINRADPFERRAFRYMEKNPVSTFYYEFDDTHKQLFYLEPLKTASKCLECHSDEKMGDVRGGISIVHNVDFFYKESALLLQETAVIAAIFLGMLFLIYKMYALLLYRNRELIQMNETLEDKVDDRTMELDSQNRYLQTILDTSPDIIIITDGEHLIKANGSFFNSFHYETLEAFRAEHDCICDFFEKVDELEYLHDKKIEGQLWPYYLISHPEIKHKVQMTIDDQLLFFSINARCLEGVCSNVLVELSDITEVELQKKGFEKLAKIDRLTGLINRFQFDVLYTHAIQNAKRYHEPLSLIMFDIDFFKKINDQFGHDIGDYTLQFVALTITQRLRSSDIFARWGGEEFMILLPKNDYDEAMTLAEDLRCAIENVFIDTIGNITISFGVAVMQEGDDEASLLKRADRALYMAKERGRNRVEFCS